MNMTLFAPSKEFRNRAVLLIVCCLSLVLFSFGIVRAVFSLLTLDSDRPSSTVRYPIDTRGSLTGASRTASGRSDQYEQSQALDVSSLGTALDYVRYADSLGTVLSPLQVIRTMHLRDPFSAPEELANLTNILTTGVASETQRGGPGRLTPAGAVEKETPEPRELVAFSRELATSGLVAPATLAASLEILSGRRWTYSLVPASGMTLAPVESRLPGSVAATTREVHARLAQVFDRVVAGQEVVSRADISADTGIDIEVDTWEDTSESDRGPDRTLYARTRATRDSVVVFPWLKSTTVTSIPRSGAAGMAPAVPTDRAVSVAVSQLSPTGVAPAMARAETEVRETRRPTDVLAARFEPVSDDGDSAPLGAVGRSIRTVAGAVFGGRSEVPEVDRYLGLYAKLPAGAADRRFTETDVNTDGTSVAEASAPYIPAPVIRWLDAAGFSGAAAEDLGQDVAYSVAHRRPLGTVASSLASALDEIDGGAEELAMEPEDSGEHPPWWMAFPAVPRSDLSFLTPVTTSDKSLAATPVGGLVPSARLADSPMSSSPMDMESGDSVKSLPEPFANTLPQSRVVTQVTQQVTRQEAIGTAIEGRTKHETGDATAQVPVEDTTETALTGNVLTDGARLVPGSSASTVQKLMAPTIADSPQQPTDDTATRELTPIVWPSITVTGIIVTDDGRASATIHIDGKRMVISPGQRLGELEVLSIGSNYLELGIGDDIRRYRIGDGGVE